MNYYYAITNSINSDGFYKPAISIYFSGCDKPVKCKDCQNIELQQQEVGYCNDIGNLLLELDSHIKKFKEFHSELRVCFVGGEPLAPYNRKAVYGISKYLKDNYKDVITIVYTWRTIEDIINQNLREFLQHVDYGVLGEFKIESFVENTIPASSNQIIYDFKNKKIIKPIIKGEC